MDEIEIWSIGKIARNSTAERDNIDHTKRNDEIKKWVLIN